MNTVPCNQCAHHDQQHVYRGTRKEPAWYGWCKRQSGYPAKEWDGAQFDVDVRRVAASAHRAEPLVVDSKGVLPGCLNAMPRPRTP